MRVLIVEQEQTTARAMSLMLIQDGFEVYRTELAEEAENLVKLYDYDIVLSEIDLPDDDGLELLHRIRLAKINVPWMIVTHQDDIKTKIKGFGFGVDDYLTKPFHREELVARVYAVIRRSRGHAQSIIRTGKIEVNLNSKTVSVDSKPLYLTGKEYQIIELLSLRKGITVTKEMFLDHLYGGISEPEMKIIDVFICKLRKKINQMNNGVNHISTIWGRGYVLSDPVEEQE